MKIKVNRAQFLDTAPLIPFESDVTLMADNGILSIASFTAGMTLKIVGYIFEPGQAFLTAEQWHELVHEVYQSKRMIVDINIK